ncbi:hypothetical protein FOA52_013403 [Chlamydomonas sp. UWO 241]|nr:hypothetical protein FOA52_013403 [Chlamydomonas sp. UWO 241]
MHGDLGGAPSRPHALLHTHSGGHAARRTFSSDTDGTATTTVSGSGGSSISGSGGGGGSGSGSSGTPARVSVVIMNWLRPDNVKRVLRQYTKYDAVLEVIVWMCHPDTRFNFSHAKVRIVDDVSANDLHGLSTRFKGCLMAASPWVLIQDDDHYLKEEGLARMMAAKAASPTRLIGAFGRDWGGGWGDARYVRSPVRPGPVRIVLTVLMLTDTATCAAFWDAAPAVESFVAARSSPLWNGEDIFFSLVAQRASGLVPLVVRAKKVFMKQRGIGISQGDNASISHDAYRDAFLRHAVAALGLGNATLLPSGSEEEVGEVSRVAASSKANAAV